MKSSETTGPHSARLAAVSPWLWLAFVIASQTSVAGRLAEALFTMLFGAGGPAGGALHFALQKTYHVFLFFPFGWLLSLPAAGRSLVRCALLVLAVGAGAESLQLWAPDRSPQLSDALLNVAAGTAAVLVRALLRRT